MSKPFLFKIFKNQDYKQCQVQKINETIDQFNLFGLTQTQEGLFNMKPPNDFFHFNNGYAHVKI